MTGHRFDATILREYDIRGIVGETLHEADARALGRAYAKILVENGGRSVAVGRDGRLSSPALETALVDGLTASGIDVARVGLGPTPMLYFAGHTLGVDGALMVTGSHNPANHNGFKLMLGKKSMYGDDIKRLGAVAASGDFVSGQGRAETRLVKDAYVARLLKDFSGTRKLRIAWDAGNGATGEVLQAITARLPGEHILLNETIDGRFPAHHPDPTEPENLLQIQDIIRRNKCDLGIAFDGDGDRIGVVDGDGNILWGDQLLVVLAKEVLAAQPGAQIIADVKASQVLFDEITRMGGKPLMWRTGHSLIKSKMAETGAPLAGEMSGHIFYADRYYGYDDALYAAIRADISTFCNRREPGGDAAKAAGGRQHARNSHSLRRYAEICGDRRSQDAPETGWSQGFGHRRRAGQYGRWLVAATRVEYPGRPRGARRSGRRGEARSPDWPIGATTRQQRYRDAAAASVTAQARGSRRPVAMDAARTVSRRRGPRISTGQRWLLPFQPPQATPR